MLHEWVWAGHDHDFGGRRGLESKISLLWAHVRPFPAQRFTGVTPSFPWAILISASHFLSLQLEYFASESRRSAFLI